MIDDAEVLSEDTPEREIRITIVPPHYVKYCWEAAAKFLDPAASKSRGRHDIESIREEVERGVQLLWVMFLGDDEMVGAFTTSVLRYPRKSVVSISFMGGDSILQYKSSVIDDVSEYALEMNCSGIEAIGRKGWIKALGPLGFEEAFMVLEKDL